MTIGVAVGVAALGGTRVLVGGSGGNAVGRRVLVAGGCTGVGVRVGVGVSVGDGVGLEAVAVSLRSASSVPSWS
jgi:hypothetical protein